MNKQPVVTEATRIHILNAFWELYREIPFEKISVNAIASKANIHRSTFYRYFTDTQNVLDALEDDLLEKIKQDNLYNLGKLFPMLKSMPSEEAMAKGDEFISKLLMKHAEKIYYLTNVRGDSHFKDKLYDWLREQAHEFITPQNSNEFDYLFTLIFTIMITNANYCYEHRDEYDPKMITAISRRVLKNCTEFL